MFGLWIKFRWSILVSKWSPLVHWNRNVFILVKFTSPTALVVVKMTTSNAAGDENFVKVKTFLFQCTLLGYVNHYVLPEQMTDEKKACEAM